LPGWDIGPDHSQGCWILDAFLIERHGLLPGPGLAGPWQLPPSVPNQSSQGTYHQHLAVRWWPDWSPWPSHPLPIQSF
jgi:hypothetical protein